jgi:hypothetical protein
MPLSPRVGISSALYLNFFEEPAKEAYPHISIVSKIISVERVSMYFIKPFDDEHLVFVGVLE